MDARTRQVNDLRWLEAIRRSTSSLLILVFALGTSVGEAARKPQKPGRKIKEQNLEQHYREWLDRDVAYIITREERDTFLHLTFDDARDKFIDRFWEIRNPVPGSPVNTPMRSMTELLLSDLCRTRSAAKSRAQPSACFRASQWTNRVAQPASSPTS